MYIRFRQMYIRFRQMYSGFDKRILDFDKTKVFFRIFGILVKTGFFQGVLEAVIGALTGAEDRNEVSVMAKQATEVRRSPFSFL